MVNHHRGGNRPHHPLWGLVSTPQRAAFTIGLALVVLSMFAPAAANQLVANAAYGLAPIAHTGLVLGIVFLGFSLILRGGRGSGNRRGGGH